MSDNERPGIGALALGCASPRRRARGRGPHDVVLRRQRGRGDAGPRSSASRPRTPTSRSSSTTSPTASSSEQLPVQLEAGSGPDIARVTKLKAQAQALARPAPAPQGRRLLGRRISPTTSTGCAPDGSNAIPGFMTQLTVTGRSSTRRCSSRPACQCRATKATWDEWAEAAKKVAAEPEGADRARLWTAPATASPARRSPWAPSISARTASPPSSTTASRRWRSRIADWHEDGTMPKEVWGGVAGQTYKRRRTRSSSTARSSMYYLGLLAGRASSPRRSATPSTGRRSRSPAGRPPAPACRAAPASSRSNTPSTRRKWRRVME